MADDTTPELPAPTSHIGVWVDVSAQRAYEFIADIGNMPRWAAGLDLDAVTVELAAPNVFGVLDHIVEVPGGQRFFNPMRVVAEGEGRQCCEIVFGVRRRGSVTDAEFEADVAAVRTDLMTLKGLLEAG
ncbi:MAG: SRPBCC family protein [Mycobacterium sp.]|nr:SRPBCC family protein [Mycobacterium sp.]